MLLQLFPGRGASPREPFGPKGWVPWLCQAAAMGRGGFGVLSWGAKSAERFPYPSKLWLLFFLGLAQDVSAAQGTATGAVPPHGLAGHGAPSPWGPQPGVLPSCSWVPAVPPTPGLVPTDGDAPRSAGLSQRHDLRSFFADTTRLSDTAGPMGTICRETWQPGGGRWRRISPIPTSHDTTIADTGCPLSFCGVSSCTRDGEQVAQGQQPLRGDELLHAGEK